MGLKEREDKNMTIKELKEKIKENPNKLLRVEKDLISMGFLELFNENLRVEKVIKSPTITLQAMNILKDIYKRYDDNFTEEVKKFIDFASKQLPNFAFDYTIKTDRKGVVTIWFTYIYNNKLIRKSILYHSSDNKVDCNWLLERIMNTVEKSYKHF
jgi:hypothetical protein